MRRKDLYIGGADGPLHRRCLCACLFGNFSGHADGERRGHSPKLAIWTSKPQMDLQTGGFRRSSVSAHPAFAKASPPPNMRLMP